MGDLAFRPRDLGIGRLFERVRDAVIVADAHTGRIVLWNQAATEIFGYSVSEALEMNVEELVPERLRERHRAGLARYRETGHGTYIDSHELLELPAVRKTGKEIRVEMSLSPIQPTRDVRDEERRLVLAIVRDITERNRTEEALRESEARFHALVQNALDIVMVTDAHGTIRYISPSIERVLGYRSKEMVGTSTAEYVHPDDLERALGELAEAASRPGVHPVAVETRVRHKDGSWRHLEGIANNLLDDPAVGGVVFNHRDVTERKRAEEEVRRLNEELEYRVKERTARLETALAELRASEERHRLLVDNVEDYAIFMMDPNGCVLDWNVGAERIFGYWEVEIVGEPSSILFTPQDIRHGAPERELRKAEEEGRAVDERWHMRKDGSRFWSSGFVRPIRDGAGNLRGFAKVARDITERKQAEEALRQSEERYRAVVKQSTDGIYLVDGDTRRILETNPALQKMLGYTADELSGMELHEIVAHERESVYANVERTLKEGKRFIRERSYRRKDGLVVEVEVVASAIHYGGKRVICAAIRDITERKRAEEALRESERKYRTLVEQVPAITYIEAVDREDRRTDLLYVSPQITAVFGYSPGEWMANPELFESLLHPDDRERVLAEDARTDETGELFSVEYRQFTRDGRVIWVTDEAVLVKDEEGRPLYWQGVMHDITDQKRTEEALRQGEELYRSVVEQTAESIFIVDAKTKRILEANAALYNSLGYAPEELEDMTLYDIAAHDRESIDRNVERILHEGQRSVGERRYRRKDGSLIDVEVSASAISYGGRETMCIVAHDVTERKQVEENLRQSLGVLLALREAGHVLGSTLESEEVVSRLLEIMRGVSNLTAAVISVQDEADGVHIWRAAGLQGLWRRARFAPEAEAARQTGLERGEQRLFRLRHPELESEDLVALYLPLRSRERILGVLEAYGQESLAESDAVEILASLASQAASALENAQLYEKLEEREQRLQELVGKLLRAQEEERRRVAYEVHDGLAQIAAAAHQHLQAFAERYAPGAEKGRRDLERILRLVRATVSDSRRIIADLRPTTLDDLGLAATIAQEVERLREDGYLVDYQDEFGDERLPAAAEIALFRVAQEALTNVRKHAQTRQVSIKLRRGENEACLEVRDYGRGFDLEVAPLESGPGERVGLAGMRERISMLDGRLEIRGEPDVGTTVAATVPLVQAT